MSFDSLLTHTVSLVRRLDLELDDEYGQATTVETVVATVAAAIQPRSETATSETGSVGQAGPALMDTRIFLRPLEISTGDYVVHDAAACGESNDLPDGRYELVGTPHAAGLGHHMELDARLIRSEALELAPSS